MMPAEIIELRKAVSTSTDKTKYDAEEVLKNWELCVNGTLHSSTASFLKNCAKNNDTIAYVVNCIFKNYFLVFSVAYTFNL